MSLPVRRFRLPADSGAETEALLRTEWLITNGLGGYACGTVSGAVTRRYHGLLVAGLHAPYGRLMMLNDVSEQVRFADGACVRLSAPESGRGAAGWTGGELREFRVEGGLPVWTYELQGATIEKRVVMPHRQNTVYLWYRMLAGDRPVRLELFPALHFRHADDPVNTAQPSDYAITIMDDRYEISAADLPPLRLRFEGGSASFTVDRRRIGEVMYDIEASRGYASRGEFWLPGLFHVDLAPGGAAALVASTERWERMTALSAEQADGADRQRRGHLLVVAGVDAARDPVAAELVLAADQFLITPAGRVQDSARARASGYEVRTVIAGYHWFTDWGRDTMISLEGLTLATGRPIDAGSILRTFAYYIKDGLIPNMFPEGQLKGLYHTADATLWFFHAVDRYVRATRDRATLRLMLPRLEEIVRRHLEGTLFNIGVDPADGLLRQGQEGYQLTWMDAKVDDWVVTPRRGKAVEINALWYNALCLLTGWLREEEGEDRARPYGREVDRVFASFNRRFWNASGGFLFDVVDAEAGDDPALRPNQLLAISLEHPVLQRDRWPPVLDAVRERLLTPVGLRTLARDHADYKPRYYGDLRTRDAAYHQGTVWPWLLGPFVDAWLRAHPDDRASARSFLEGVAERLAGYCVGTLAEIFDAEEPYAARGCVAQAWSVAEVLRGWLRTAS